MKPVGETSSEPITITTIHSCSVCSVSCNPDLSELLAQCSAFRALNSFCAATEHSTASTTLANSARMLSPGESMTRPRCCWISYDMIFR